MAWLIIQSLPVIVLAFLLGLVVGWLWWQRRKVQFSQSDAVTSVTTRHEAAMAAKQGELTRTRADLTEKDAELARLTALVSDDTAALAAEHDGVLAVRDAHIAELTTRVQAGRSHLSARTAEVESRDAEISRLSAIIEQAEAVAATHRDELAARDDRLTEQQAALADRDAEIGRLSAALHSATANSPAARAATASAPAGATAASVTAEPTEPTSDELARFATPVEDLAGPEAVAGPAAVPEPQVGTDQAGDASATTALPVETPVEAPAQDDDLERIEGIGPRIGAALRGAGIRTFRQLADADITTLQGALEQAGLRFAPSLPTWSRQSALLADGDEAGFVALTERLVAGRDISGTK